MTLRHQSKKFSVMSATCDHLEIQSATSRAPRHQTPWSGDAKCHESWTDQKSDNRNRWPMASRRVSESSPFIDHPARSCLHKPFPYKIKRKGGEFDKCKVRLVVQGQHMRRKDDDSVGDYADTVIFENFQPRACCKRIPHHFHLSYTTEYVRCPHRYFSGFRFRQSYCPETAIMARCIFLYLRDIMKILSTCIVYLSHFTILWYALCSQCLAHHDEHLPGKRRMCNSGIWKEHASVNRLFRARILPGAHINDFVIACANRQELDAFRVRLLDAFEGTYEGALQHYLRCEVT